MHDARAARTILDSFSEHELPDLDVAVLGALDMLAERREELPLVPHLPQPLVVGSGNAASVGQILYRHTHALYADESTYAESLTRAPATPDEAVIISASGGKHAVSLAADLAKRDISTWLMTCNPDAPAAQHIVEGRTCIFPKNREPYTYNVSTYLGMLISGEGEDPVGISEHIVRQVLPAVSAGALREYDAFYFVLPPDLILLAPMIRKKFGELFGSRVSVRALTAEQTKHGELVVPSATECFISLGEEPAAIAPGAARIHIPLPAAYSYATGMAVCYYLIGCIQRQHPPYFKEHIDAYARAAANLFHEHITVIVD